MALGRRGWRRAEVNIWPGFVDAMTALLLVLMFVLTIFMVIQSVLRETITSQGSQLDSLTGQLADLADALGLERERTAELAAEGERQAATIATLTATLAAREGDLAQARGDIAAFETRLAALLAEKQRVEGALGESETVRQAGAAEADGSTLDVQQQAGAG